jgi:hypothetical protein
MLTSLLYFPSKALLNKEFGEIGTKIVIFGGSFNPPTKMHF